MTRAEFIEWLKGEVTLSGALSINLPDAEYNRIIDRELKQLYELYKDTLRETYTIIPVEYFYKPEFRKNRTIQFPSCVYSVNRFVEMHRRNSLLGFNDPDFSFNRAFMADMWLGSQVNLDSVAYRTIQMCNFDMLKRFTLIDIQHRWNYPSHTLLVLGHDPRVDVWCGLHVKVDEQELFEDTWVQKWISAHCRLAGTRMLGLFNVQLLSGVTLNIDTISNNATDDLEKCREYFNQTNTPGWFRTIP